MGKSYLREIKVLTKEEEPRKGVWLLCECLACGKKDHKICKYNLKHVNSCGCRKYHKNNYHPKWSGIGEISQTLYSTIKCAAKSRNIEWNLSIEFIWELFIKQDRKCAISGVIITLPNSSRGFRTASLDRIDSNRGYIETNVQWVHSSINIMKWKLPQDEFIKWCRIVAKNNQTKDLIVNDDFAGDKYTRLYHPGNPYKRKNKITTNG